MNEGACECQDTLRNIQAHRQTVGGEAAAAAAEGFSMDALDGTSRHVNETLKYVLSFNRPQ